MSKLPFENHENNFCTLLPLKVISSYAAHISQIALVDLEPSSMLKRRCRKGRVPYTPLSYVWKEVKIIQISKTLYKSYGRK